MLPSRMQLSFRQVLLLLVDLVIVFAALPIAWALRMLDPQFVGQAHFIFEIRTGATLLLLIVFIMTFYVFELYNTVIDFRRAAGVARIMAATLTATAFLVGIFYIVPFWKLSRGVSLLHAGVTALCVIAWRMGTSAIWARSRPTTPTLIVGAGRMGRMVLEAIEARTDRGLGVVGFLDDDPAKQDGECCGYPILGGSDALEETVRERGVGMIVIALKRPQRVTFARDLLNLKSKAVQIIHGATLYKYLTGRVPILYVDDFYFLFGRDLHRMANPVLRNFHRLFDIGVSSVGLLLASPLLLLGMLLVRLTSRGPIFYKQVRVGLNKRHFNVLKLRTMRVDAEKETGAVMAKPGSDPRVTPVGKFLRRSRIDELPQLLTVLRGDMSFIGPRPERPEFTEQFEKEIPYYALRSAVKPGLTGWAQVNFRYGSNADDTAVKLQYDLYYLQEMGLLLDLHILIKTVQTVLFRSGS